MESALLTTRETAAYLGLGETKTKELLRRRVFPTIKIGKSLRVPRAALDRWIEQQVAEHDASDRG